MSDPNAALTLQLLEWIASDRRTYADVIDAWRTTCPRLSIWEDACMDGLIDREPNGQIVTVSAKGRSLLLQGRPDRAEATPPTHKAAYPASSSSSR